MRWSSGNTLLYFLLEPNNKLAMKSDPREIYGLFSRLNGLSRCIFFHSFHSWKKIQLERPFSLSKTPYISLGSDFIVFFFHSLTLITINVRQVQFSFFFLGIFNIGYNLVWVPLPPFAISHRHDTNTISIWINILELHIEQKAVYPYFFFFLEIEIGWCTVWSLPLRNKTQRVPPAMSST